MGEGISAARLQERVHYPPLQKEMKPPSLQQPSWNLPVIYRRQDCGQSSPEPPQQPS